jgi:alkylation response protein AidB-like acyl-CoA dehydrogenase
MVSFLDHDRLRETVRTFRSREAEIGDLRALRDERSGFDRALWTGIVALGWPGIPFPEALGGHGLGYSALGTVLTELGRSLTPTPFLSSVVLAGQAIRLGGSAAQQEATLPQVVHGRQFLAFAHQEGPVFRPYDIRLSAKPTTEGHVLRGSKTLVLDAHVAESLVAVARTSGRPGERDGLTLFLVDTRLPGVRVVPGLLLDSRIAATVEFTDVEIGRDQILGELDRGAEILDPVLARGAAALAAEMLGGIEECFERTVAYLRERHQFGVPIGSFQALQHRAADWCCEVELTRAIVEEALALLDDGDWSEANATASAAKARASEVFMRSAAEAIQLFAGIGMTDAHDIGFFLKRARAAEQTLGDAPYHRTHFAAVRGYW